MASQRTRSLDRLKELNPVFTVGTLGQLFGMPPGVASTYIARWKELGLVASLGERTGIHFNLLKDPAGPRDRRQEAIAYLLPGARIIGASALHAAGWTTQYPRRLEIAVPPRRTLPAIPDVDISQRPKIWFSTAGRELLRDGHIPVLAPAEALADAWKTGLWRPDPDELEWDEIDREAVSRAFRRQGIDLPSDWDVTTDEPCFPDF
ncbi:hypothetical protein LAZ40_04240 [Cereibacter sphaeroides]|uniref:hypothetical protein n=1 Tax=Cereibacter sphaeroides TaxID=1063 RepID=UPI001F349A03|nr:hypothetical protein [Cereibacter sphaeroides]MCE6958264.1 hypothetical protein [Cereibacter sphaeroides]MCE6971327.1 hypothetical protein [Cereibacter sphaeroides]